MNNFYGYLPKNNSKFSNSPSGDDNITGLWNSKKNRQKIEKEAQLLKNRVNLLELEDRKLKKKIDENKQKMMSFIEKRQRNFQDISSVILFCFCKPILSFFKQIFFFFKEIEKKRV